jgi:ABC-2 type transport system permease protein
VGWKRYFLRSPRPVLLFKKDWSELRASRAFWILLLIVGPLVGHGFITAVNSYAEMSGNGSGPAALAQGLTPLDGILTPTFGAYDLAATFLFPFVAIRMIAAERESGAWKLMLQSPSSTRAMIASKCAALLVSWLICFVAGGIAIGLWHGYGGTIYWPELLNLLLGHLLRAGISAAIAVSAAACISGAANAAIVALALTLGTWILEFVAEGRGGWIQIAASFTPTAALRTFERGDFRLSVVFVALLILLTAFCFTCGWMKLTLPRKHRWTATWLIVLLAAAGIAAASRARWARDVSEDRRNSFSREDEAALSHITGPLHITVNLAAEDPRLMDLERSILQKLRRVLPNVSVQYVSAGRSGLFANGDEHYGEIAYEYGGKKMMSRSTTEPIVLEKIYDLTGVAAPTSRGDREFSGHPLAVTPKYAAAIFYLLWPVLVISLWFLNSRLG